MMMDGTYDSETIGDGEWQRSDGNDGEQDGR